MTGPRRHERFEDVQTAIIGALESQVKQTFFPEACGADGLGCPSVTVLLKCLDNFALTDDGVLNQIVVADIDIQMSERL